MAGKGTLYILEIITLSKWFYMDNLTKLLKSFLEYKVFVSKCVLLDKMVRHLLHFIGYKRYISTEVGLVLSDEHES